MEIGGQRPKTQSEFIHILPALFQTMLNLLIFKIGLFQKKRVKMSTFFIEWVPVLLIRLRLTSDESERSNSLLAHTSLIMMRMVMMKRSVVIIHGFIEVLKNSFISPRFTVNYLPPNYFASLSPFAVFKTFDPQFAMDFPQ